MVNLECFIKCSLTVSAAPLLRRRHLLLHETGDVPLFFGSTATCPILDNLLGEIHGRRHSLGRVLDEVPDVHNHGDTDSHANVGPPGVNPVDRRSPVDLIQNPAHYCYY